MLLGDIYEKLNALSPFELQEAWDNSGLLLGAFEERVSQIVVSLDVDVALIEASPKDALFIVHHPLIFSPLKRFDFQTYPARLLQKMILKNQKLIAMHTNFDQTHLNSYVAKAVLGLDVVSSEGFVVYAACDLSFEALAHRVQAAFGLETTKVVPTKRTINRIALCTGSGASMIPAIKADVYLTGDIKYHDAMHADALGLGLIDIGHYESERYFSELLASLLNDWPISVIISSSKNPFHYIKAQK